MPALNPKQQQFIREYLIDMNATQAAIRAGYSERTAKQQGSRLLSHVDVQAALAKGKVKVIERAEAKFDLTLDRLLAEYQRIAMTGMSKFMRISPDGDPIIDLSACEPADLDLLSEVTVEDFTEGRGEDSRNVRKIKIKPLDRLNAMDKLGKHLGMGNKVETDNVSTLAAALLEIGKRGSSAPIAED